MNSRLHTILALSLALSLALPAFAGKDKKDPDAIGERDVDGKLNFYSLEKEIGLGKQMATEVERHSRDARILGIGGGTTEVMTELAAARLGW